MRRCTRPGRAAGCHAPDALSAPPSGRGRTCGAPVSRLCGAEPPPHAVALLLERHHRTVKLLVSHWYVAGNHFIKTLLEKHIPVIALAAASGQQHDRKTAECRLTHKILIAFHNNSTIKRHAKITLICLYFHNATHSISADLHF